MTQVVNTETKATLSLDELKARLPGWSPPYPPSPESLEGTGWTILEYDPVPSYEHAPGDIREEDGRYIQAWKPAELTPEAWIDKIADRRYQAEVSGITLSGIPVATDDRSKLLISGAAQRAAREPGYTLRWKTYEGFIDLSAEQVQAMADAVADHVQACFNREAELQAAVADGSITAEMLEQGWP